MSQKDTEMNKFSLDNTKAQIIKDYYKEMLFGEEQKNKGQQALQNQELNIQREDLNKISSEHRKNQEDLEDIFAKLQTLKSKDYDVVLKKEYTQHKFDYISQHVDLEREMEKVRIGQLRDLIADNDNFNRKVADFINNQWNGMQDFAQQR